MDKEDRLRERFDDGHGRISWEAVREADNAAVEEAIRPGGISKVKSARIKAILRAITDTRGCLDLDWLPGATTSSTSGSGSKRAVTRSNGDGRSRPTPWSTTCLVRPWGT